MGTDITTFKKTYRTLNEPAEKDFPPVLDVRFIREYGLKYGENPHQRGAVYVLGNAQTIANATNILGVNSKGKGKGGLSLTNMMDITKGIDLLKYFSNAVVIMKHAVVSGMATKDLPQDELYRLARDADRRSAFGGSVIFKQPLAMKTAEAILELYKTADKPDSNYRMDVIAATEFDDGVIGFIEKRAKDIRVAQWTDTPLPKFATDVLEGMLSLKGLPTGRIGIQDPYLTRIASKDYLILDAMVTKEGVAHEIARKPTEQELADMLTAWYITASVKSNGIVLVKDGVTVAVGSGQTERVGAVEQAIVKGMQKAMDREGIAYDALRGVTGSEKLSKNPFLGAVCGSDAFFPFPDSITTLAKVGVSGVVQPFGSEQDAFVIDELNKHNMAAAATLERCFEH